MNVVIPYLVDLSRAFSMHFWDRTGVHRSILEAIDKRLCAMSGCLAEYVQAVQSSCGNTYLPALRELVKLKVNSLSIGLSSCPLSDAVHSPTHLSHLYNKSRRIWEHLCRLYCPLKATSLWMIFPVPSRYLQLSYRCIHRIHSRIRWCTPICHLL